MRATSERRLRLYVAVVFVVGGGVVAYSVWRVPILSTLVFVTLVVLADFVMAKARHGVSMSLSSVVSFTALMLYGPFVAICADTSGVLSSWPKYENRVLEKILFNFGQKAIATGTAATIFVIGGGTVGEPAKPQNWVLTLAAALVYQFVSQLLVAGAVSLSSGERMRSSLGSLTRVAALQSFYAAFAIFAASLLVKVGLSALLFLVVPVLVARQAMLGYQAQASAYDKLVKALLKAIEVKDGYTGGHTERVSTLCIEVGRELGLNYEQVRAIEYAAKLHDVGKLAVPNAIINKPGPLDDDEWVVMRTHPTVGAEILDGIDFLDSAIDGVRFHHERVDGRGYPFGMDGEELPLVARIITVCDAFDAMTTTRSYRGAREVAAAIEELRRCAGSQFDPQIIDILEQVTSRLNWQPTYESFKPSLGRLYRLESV